MARLALAEESRSTVTSTRSMTLMDALNEVEQGSMEGALVYAQLPAELQSTFNKLSEALGQTAFSTASRLAQSKVCGLILTAVREANNATKR